MRNDGRNHLPFSEMEVEAFRARREKEAKFASYALQLGAGIGVTAATGGAGLLPYLAGAGTFTGVGIALDQEIHANIKAGDWPGALDLSSYYLPFVGAGRNSWDAWHANQYWRAAGHASLLGVEVVGLRGAGKVRWGGVKVAKGTPKATQGVERGVKGAKSITQFERLKAALAQEEILSSEVIGSALKKDDLFHRVPSFVIDDIAKKARLFSIKGKDGLTHNLTQMKGEINGQKGVFEWIINAEGKLTHQRFIVGGRITGLPNQKLR